MKAKIDFSKFNSALEEIIRKVVAVSEEEMNLHIELTGEISGNIDITIRRGDETPTDP